MLSLSLNAYYGAISDQDWCKNLEKLPIISKKFYEKFKDTKATLALYEEHGSLFYYYLKKPSCLSDATFDALFKEYARLESISGDYRTMEKLLKKNPQKTFLLKYLGDLYKGLYTSKEKGNTRDKAKYRVLALGYYNKYVESGGKPDKVMKKFLKSKGLHKAKNRWFDKFSIDKVPEGSYRAIYFNSKFPDKIIKESIVPYPAANYNGDKFPGDKIPSNDFAAYWVGDMVFDKDMEKTLNLRVSWSEYRLIIDGYEVSKGNNNGAEIPYLFTKGKHRIEVEYLNNYGATDFMMTMYDKREYIDQQEIKKYISGDYLLFYVSLYESSNFDNSLDLKLREKYNKPIVLLLSSYGNIDWKIDANGNEIKTVFVSSYSRGSIVSLKEKKSLEKYYLSSFSRSDGLGIKCECSSTYSTYCKGESFVAFDAEILEIFNKHLDGFTTFYPRERAKNRTYSVPRVLLTKETREKMIQEEKEANRIKSECERERNLGIDDIF